MKDRPFLSFIGYEAGSGFFIANKDSRVAGSGSPPI